MNIVTHVLRKDIRRTRILLAVWLVLLALQFVLIGSSINPGDQAMQALYEVLSQLVPLFQALVLIVIVPHVIQDEPLVGTTAFWFTRPISRGALLRSKTLFALLVLALPPLIAETIVLAANGATGHDLCLAAPEIVMGQLAFILCVAILAVITPNFGRFAIFGAVVVVAMILLEAAIQLTGLFLHPESFMNQAAHMSLTKSRSVVGSLLMIVAGGTLIAHQYLTRKTARTIAGAVLGMALVLLAQSYWPWDFLERKPMAANDPNFDAGAIKISLTGEVDTSEEGTIRGQGEPSKNIQPQIETLGVPKGYIVKYKDVDPHLTLPDGQAVKVTSSLNDYSDGRQDADALEAALGGTPIVNASYYSDNDNLQYTSFFTVDAATYRQYAAVPLKFSAKMNMVASKFVVTAEMPLAKGSRYDHGSEHVVITDVLNQPGGVDIVLRERKLNLLFDLKEEEGGEVVYLLLNKKRGEAVIKKQNGSFSVNFQTGAERLVNHPVTLSFGPEQNNPQMLLPLTPEWIADATLVRLELIPVAEFSKELEADKFLLNGKGPFLGGHYEREKPDLEALNKIALPENATKEQVRDYVDAIMVASRKQNSFSDNDPQIAMLEKVGPENLDVLIEFASRLGSNAQGLYTTGAIQNLARPDDKALILQALPDDRDLADLVVKYGWQSDARDTLLAGLAQEKRDLPEAWIKAVASLQDPSTYPALKDYLIDGNNKRETFKAIKQLPGINLSDTVEAMWKKAKYDSSYDVVDACEIAAESGIADAVDTAARILKTENNEYELKQVRKVITKFTPATGNDAALIAWVESNRGKLVFDKQSGKFLPQK